MNYQEFKKQRQEAYNALPVKYAFSNEQFKEMMEEWGLTEKDTDKIYKLGNTGGFYLKSDAPKIRAWMNDDSDEQLEKLMQDEEFAVGAYYYEMCNHEFGINWDGKADVLSACDLNEKQLNSIPELKQAWNAAKKQYDTAAEKNGWF